MPPFELDRGRLGGQLVRAATQLLQRLGSSRIVPRRWRASQSELDEADRSCARACYSATRPALDLSEHPAAGLLGRQPVARIYCPRRQPDDRPRLWPLTDRAASRAGQRAILPVWAAPARWCWTSASSNSWPSQRRRSRSPPWQPCPGRWGRTPPSAWPKSPSEMPGPPCAWRPREPGQDWQRAGTALPARQAEGPQQQADGYRQLAQVQHPQAEVLLAEAARTGASEIDREILYLPALAVAGGPIAVQTLRELLGAEPNETVLSRLHAELPADTAARALTVWERLAYDPSSAWGKMAVASWSRIRIEPGLDRVRVALDGTDWIVREHDRNRLRGDMRKIASPRDRVCFDAAGATDRSDRPAVRLHA